MKRVYLQSAAALGSMIELRIVTPKAAVAERWFPLLWKEVANFENRFSRFRLDSELSRFNERAGERVSISEEFRALIETARHFSDISGGLFNPFVLPGLQRAGYVHSLGGDETTSIDYSRRGTVDHSSLTIGDNWASIPTDTALDLGGIGKGYLADHLAKLLRDQVEDYCLSLGGDICVKGTATDKPWEIDIQSAKDRSKNIAYFTSNQNTFGIATSGVVRQKNNREQLHIINPRTNTPIPASENLCTVVADDTTTADVMASCILIAGKNLAKKLIEKGTVKAVLLQEENSPPPFLLGEGFFLKTN